MARRAFSRPIPRGQVSVEDLDRFLCLTSGTVGLLELLAGVDQDHASRVAFWKPFSHLPGHPAAFPTTLPEFGIRLTTEPGDLVYDPMAGSGTTAFVAEQLGRRWLSSERALDYVRGAALRFEDSAGFALHLSER